MTPPRRAKLVLLVLAVALVGLGVWARKPLWWWVMTERLLVEETRHDERLRGYKSVSRWTKSPQEYGQTRLWYVRNGFKACELEMRGAEEYRGTAWAVDGTRELQAIREPPSGERLLSRPWLGGVTDQTEPTMPEWMKDDERWQAALDAQK